MIDFKQIIAEEISKAISVPKEELASYIEIPKDINNGDYAFPCFRLAKTLRKAPPVIANEIKENLKFDETIITKVEIAGGYLNFFVNKEAKIKTVLTERELKGEEPVVAEEPKKAEKKTASKAKKEATEGTEKKARKTTTKKESKAE